MDKLLLDAMQKGKDINDILDMPYNFVIELMKEESKPVYKKSLIAAFNG